METLDMNANRLQTEERKIQWLENEIKYLEYVLSSDCMNRNLKLCQLQMYRELLAIKRGGKNEMYWHKYTNCGDAPHVKEYQKETFLCKVQRVAKDNEEPIGAPSYQVCVCDDNGSFFGMQGSSDLCWAKVVAWTDIVPTTIGDTDAMCSKELSSDNRLPKSNFTVKVVNLALCESSSEPDLEAFADIKISGSTFEFNLNHIGFYRNDKTNEYHVNIVSFYSEIEVCFAQIHESVTELKQKIADAIWDQMNWESSAIT